MGKKLFISNLDFNIDTDTLREMFEAIGPCESVVIATERETKRSRGFAFVEMQNEEDAARAIEELNEKVVNGRPMKVAEDRGKTGSTGQGKNKISGKRVREHLPPIQRMQLFRRHKKIDPFLAEPDKTINYTDVAMLSRFVSESGKILSRKVTGLSAYNQRKVAKAIKRAQQVGLMPLTVK
ncbi:MAG: 30S ribosomal protein S18 [Candidatus Dadabacteria bacterium]|nr:MAG: 30S ribosomal protein S18 [Candidatus Dadabacteria bacterium]